jgi:hypothetical protein
LKSGKNNGRVEQNFFYQNLFELNMFSFLLYFQILLFEQKSDAMRTIVSSLFIFLCWQTLGTKSHTSLEQTSIYLINTYVALKRQTENISNNAEERRLIINI